MSLCLFLLTYNFSALNALLISLLFGTSNVTSGILFSGQILLLPQVKAHITCPLCEVYYCICLSESCLHFPPGAQHFKEGHINDNSHYVFLLLLFSTSISDTPTNCWPLLTLAILSYVALALTNKPIQLNCTLKITGLYDLCDLLRLTAEADCQSATPSTFPQLGPLTFFVPDWYYLSLKVNLYSSVWHKNTQQSLKTRSPTRRSFSFSSINVRLIHRSQELSCFIVKLWTLCTQENLRVHTH